MDRDLAEYLQGMEQRMNTRMDSLEQRVTARINANTGLVSAVSQSLQREMHAGFEQIKIQLEVMERRLDRHGSLPQTGARWTARMATWSERVDKGDTQRDMRISNLENRIRKMEEPRPPAANEGQ